MGTCSEPDTAWAALGAEANRQKQSGILARQGPAVANPRDKRAAIPAAQVRKRPLFLGLIDEGQ